MNALQAFRTEGHSRAGRDADGAQSESSDAHARPRAVTGLASAIYEGRLSHRRHFPGAHRFSYDVAYAYLDLDELDTVLSLHPLVRSERGGLAVFRRSDYLGEANRPLIDCVKAAVREAIGDRAFGPIRLLTHLRSFGHCFNPVSFYYGFAPGGDRLEWVLAEITNTPWKERHRYVLEVEGENAHQPHEWRFPKRFHVSPFLPMQRDYRWRFTLPDQQLAVYMEVRDGDQVQFLSALNLQRRPMTRAGLSRLLWKHPAMTLKVVAAIHWQALRTWLKRNPFHSHPERYPDSQP